MGRFIERVLFKAPQPRHSLLQSALLEQLQGLTLAGRLDHVRPFPFPSLPRIRCLGGSVAGRCGQILNVTRPVDDLVAEHPLLQCGLPSLGGKIHAVLSALAVRGGGFKRSLQHVEIGTQHVFELTAVVSQTGEIHDCASATETNASTDADKGADSAGSCWR